MRPRVYLETTIPSYLTARPSRDFFLLARQRRTHEWWDRKRAEFEPVVSQLVVSECAGGDPSAAAARLSLIADLTRLTDSDDTLDLSQVLAVGLGLPERAAADATHIAVAAVHGVEYLMTWNCAHIANAAHRGRIDAICRGRGFRPPVICTPEELMGEDVDD